MKKLITIILIMALALPALALAEPDPIVGAWYMLIDYSRYPFPEMQGKNYMIYVLIFEESGIISGISGESAQGDGLTASGSTLGAWVKNGDSYTVSMIGIGNNKAEFHGDRLHVQMLDNIWYSLQRMDFSDYYTDVIVK